jgi:hypothetical protein
MAITWARSVLPWRFGPWLPIEHVQRFVDEVVLAEDDDTAPVSAR